jgi:hypothetical protein
LALSASLSSSFYSFVHIAVGLPIGNVGTIAQRVVPSKATCTVAAADFKHGLSRFEAEPDLIDKVVNKARFLVDTAKKDSVVAGHAINWRSTWEHVRSTLLTEHEVDVGL